MLLETIKIPVSKLESNTGQIPEVPSNPRIIRDGKFRKLMQSIKDDPGFLELRELVVFPISSGKKFVVVGGNMRLKACLELGYKELPCKVLSPKTSPAQLRAFIMKDNISYGETDWELLANQWDEADLDHWGLDFPKGWGMEEEEETKAPAPEKLPVVGFTIQFTDLDQYAQARARIEQMLVDYPSVLIKEK